MKLAVSNIAWPKEADATVAEMFVSRGLKGIEIAPTKVWPNPTSVSDGEIDSYRSWWADRGITIVAAQSLLFGRPDLTLFDSEASRERTVEYLKHIFRVCGRLGARSLVFGSPKNRLVGKHDRETIGPIAIDLFGRLAESAAAEGTCLVMEANPPEYGADFLTRAAEAISLVRTVDHPGFRWHLDTGCMTLAGDPPRETIAVGFDLLQHVHVSEPNLAAIGSGDVGHAEFADALRMRQYAGWVSVEMREGQPFVPKALLSALDFAVRIYGP
jgi:D-psicose/D-tagatose/L-ribulose 3-epimerase